MVATTGHSKAVFLVALAILLGMQGCETPQQVLEISGGSTRCVAGQAQIHVYDGFFQNVCGCQEPAGTFFAAGNLLTCTVPRGTTIFFFYPPTSMKHQVFSSDGSGIIASPISDPSLNSDALRSYAVPLNNPGTYPFFDTFEQSLIGKIVAL